jgi:hypothetical protein
MATEAKQPKAELRGGETIVRDGAANLQRGALENVGGHLFLTDQRLLFEAHKLNIQKEPLYLELSAIRAVDTGWTKLAGILPLFPNALILTIDGRDEPVRLTVYGKAKWLQAITAAAKAA